MADNIDDAMNVSEEDWPSQRPKISALPDGRPVDWSLGGVHGKFPIIAVIYRPHGCSTVLTASRFGIREFYPDGTTALNLLDGSVSNSMLPPSTPPMPPMPPVPPAPDVESHRGPTGMCDRPGDTEM